MKKFLFIAFLSASLLINAQENNAGKIKKSGQVIPPTASVIIDINNISAQLNMNGSHFWQPDNSSSSYFVPKGQSTTSLFASSFWIGGVEANEEVRLAAVRFCQMGNDYWAGPLSTSDASIDSETAQEWDRFWIVDRQEIIDFINSDKTNIPSSILEWPAHGDVAKGQAQNLAPFKDVDGDGIYNPHNGDYPLILGDRCVFFIFNDNAAPHTESGGQPIGVEVHAMVYGFNAPQDELLNNTLFFNYKIHNRSQYELLNTYVGVWTDIDLGYSHDDYVGCDVMRNTFYGYNGYPTDGFGQAWAYGKKPPVQTITILGGPYIDPDGYDNKKFEKDSIEIDPEYCDQFTKSTNLANRAAYNGINFGDGIVDNERLGMSRFVYHENSSDGSNPVGDPLNVQDYYYMLQGIWKDGEKMIYDANAHPSKGADGPECDFMFPGLSDPCNWGTQGVDPDVSSYGYEGWTELAVENPPGDRRGMGSCGPFTFKPGDVQELDFAYITIFPNDTRSTALQRLGAGIDHIQEAFLRGTTSYGQDFEYVATSVNVPENIAKNISVSPNPTNDKLYINLESISEKVNLRIFNRQGILCYEETIQGGVIHTISMKDFSSGMYFLRINDMVAKVVKID